jgi:hypothetical protein
MGITLLAVCWFLSSAAAAGAATTLYDSKSTMELRTQGCSQSTYTTRTFSKDLGTCSTITNGTLSGTAPDLPRGATASESGTFFYQLPSSAKFHFVAAFNVTPPAPSTTKYNAEMTLWLQGPSTNFLPHLCEAKGFATNIPGGSSAPLTVTLDCSLTQLPRIADLAWIQERMTLDITKSDGTSFVNGSEYISTQMVYSMIRREDSVSPTAESPSRFNNLTAGSTVDFKSQFLRYWLRTRPSADLALRLFDDRGVLQGSSDFITVSRTDLDVVLENTPLTIRGVTIDDHSPTLTLEAVLIDRVNPRVLAESAPITYKVAGACALKGKVFRTSGTNTYWVPGAKVELVENATGQVRATTRAVADPKDPAVESRYCFASLGAADLAKSHYLQITLADAPAKIQVIEKPGAAPLTVQTRTFALGGSSTLDMNLDRTADLNLPSAIIDLTEAAIESYWHIWRQMYRMVPKMTTATIGPAIVNMTGSGTQYDDGTLELGAEDRKPGVYPDPLWHEFGHHMFRQLYGGRVTPPSVTPPDVNPNLLMSVGHSGYANTYTTDAFNEGFSTFWASLTKWQLDGDGAGEWRWNPPGAPMDLESNMAMWDGRTDAPDPVRHDSEGEEFAIAGLLWDLVDEHSDADPRSDVNWGTNFTPLDTIELDPQTVVETIRTIKPATIQQLYTALRAALATNLSSAAGNPRGSGVSQLDEVFLMHRVFHDENGNWKYDHNGKETIGKAANGTVWKGWYYDNGTFKNMDVGARSWRQNAARIAGSNIAVKLVSSTGAPLTTGFVRVDITYPAGFEALNTSKIVPVITGNVYFQMPSADYHAVATIRVPGGSQPPLTITSAAYWGTAFSGSTFASQTFTIPDPPKITRLDPAAGAVGSSFVIEGLGFGSTPADNQVLFGDKPAKVTEASPTRLVATVPDVQASVVPVRVRTGSQSDPRNFTVADAVLAVDPRLDFGDTAVNSTKEQPLMLRNAGGVPVEVRGLSVAGDGFSLAPATVPFTIPAGGQSAVKVRFTPSFIDLLGGVLTIASSDVSASSQTVSLSGTGLVLRGGKLTPLTAAVRFASIANGQTRTVNVTVRNSGTTTFNILGASSSSTRFLSTSTFPIGLAPGGQQNIAVRYSPITTTPVDATLTIVSDDATGSTADVRLRGEAVAGGGTPCDYSLASVSEAAPKTQKDGTLAVTAAAGCTWTATSAASFVTLLSGASGTGNGTVSYRVAANTTGKARSGTLTVAGISVNVTQTAQSRRRAVRH